MPWRVFGFIGLLIVVTVFSALNVDNRSDVSLGFHTFGAVPVFLTSLISFTLGAVLVVLLTVLRRRGAERAARPAPLLTEESATLVPRAGGAAAAAPEPEEAPEPPEPEEAPEEEEAAERPPEPAGRKARWWRLGARRRNEGQD